MGGGLHTISTRSTGQQKMTLLTVWFAGTCHPSQNHYTHEFVLHCRYSSCSSSRILLQEIMPLRNFKNFLQVQLHDLMVVEFNM